MDTKPVYKRVLLKLSGEALILRIERPRSALSVRRLVSLLVRGLVLLAFIGQAGMVRSLSGHPHLRRESALHC